MYLAIDYTREEFAQTLAVKGSVQGRSPVVMDQAYIACVDRGGMSVRLYANDNAQFPPKGTLEVALYDYSTLLQHFFFNCTISQTLTKLRHR